MAYDWPPGWNETRTARAIQSYICEKFYIPKYSVRCSVEGDGRQPEGYSGTIIQVFRPLTGQPTATVHEVFARLEPFAEYALRFEVPKEKVAKHTYTTRPVYIWSPEA